jgi:hypothetical protein
MRRTYLQEDPDPGTKGSNRPGDKEQKQEPQDSENGILVHGDCWIWLFVESVPELEFVGGEKNVASGEIHQH